MTLAGHWVSGEGDSSAVVEILQLPGGEYSVIVYDSADGELMEVSSVGFDGIWLSFETRIPSTGHRARHRMKLLADGSVEHELALLENWKRIEQVPGAVGVPPQHRH